MTAKQAKTKTKKVSRSTKAKSAETQKSKSRIPKLAIAGSVVAIGAGSVIAINSANQVQIPAVDNNNIVLVVASEENPLAKDILSELKVKAAVSKDGYSREEFYDGWPSVESCSLRQRIIRRDFGESVALDDDNCTVISGEFVEPYSGDSYIYNSKDEISNGIQIDHIVALSDAWQKGAQKLDKEERYALATDPLNLLAVGANANRDKSDGDVSEWLPENVAFRCEYVARQISVKYKYQLWVTRTERDAMAEVLETCPEQRTVKSVLDSD